MRTKFRFILGIILNLFPLIPGYLLFNRFPETMAIHFNSKNIADGFMPREWAIPIIPIIFFVTYLIVYVFVMMDPLKNETNVKILEVTFGLLIAMNYFVTWTVYAYNLGHNLEISKWVMIFMAFIFFVIGVVFPKIKRNYTMGIRLPWTIHSEIVWKKTHKLAGKLWMLCGLLILLVGLITNGENWILFILIASIMTIIPIIYSYIIYKKYRE